MIGRAQLLDVDVPLPVGVTLRQVRVEADVRAMAAMEDSVFDSATLTRRLRRCCVALRSTTGWNCGWLRPMGRSSARVV